MAIKDPLPSLEALEKKIQNAQQQDVPAADSAKDGAGFGMRLGVELVSGVVVGTGIGVLLDNWLDTSPLFLLVFFALGTAAGALTFYRTVNPRKPLEK